MDKGFGKGSFLRDAPRFRGRDNHGYHEKLARASSLRNEFKAAPPHSLSTALKLLCENFTCANRSCRLDRLTPAFQRKWEEGPPDRRLVKIRFPYRQVSGKCAFLPFTSTMMCCVFKRSRALFWDFSNLFLKRLYYWILEVRTVTQYAWWEKISTELNCHLCKHSIKKT